MRTGGKRWIRTTFKIAAVGILTIIVAGFTYEHISRWGEAKRFPQVGRSVDIGGRAMNIDCAGSGGPVVVLDNGFGEPGYGWLLVQTEIAKLVRVCWYDRAGYGWSDPGPYPRTSEGIARDLHALLHAAGVPPPYVLVGASFGGFNNRLYYKLYPGEVAGLVMVDAAQEDEGDRLPRHRGRFPLKHLEHPLYLWSRAIDELGVMRLLPGLAFHRSAPEGFNPSQRDYFEYLVRRSEAGHDGEGMAFTETLAQMHAAGNLGDRPLVVLTAGLPVMPGPEGEEDHQVWVHELQMKLVHLSSRGRQVVVKNSHHTIAKEAPDTVVNAVHEMVTEVREGRQ
jgi:pimeloyl-ACP methyl ester carboxylesterase